MSEYKKVSDKEQAVILRPKENGRFEIISSHRRLLACKNLGLETTPRRIRELTDDEATIYMVDSNLHREKLLPSEKAFAYKMKYEALRHQGTSLPQDSTLRPVVTKFRSDDILGEEHGERRRQVQRYIRLTNLIPKLLQMVDNTELKETSAIAIRPTVELSFLTKEEQKMLAEYIKFNLVTPSLEQAIELNKSIQIIKRIKKERPDISIRTEIIVGFPEETLDNLKRTIDLLYELNINPAYIWPYVNSPYIKSNDYHQYKKNYIFTATRYAEEKLKPLQDKLEEKERSEAYITEKNDTYNGYQLLYQNGETEFVEYNRVNGSYHEGDMINSVNIKTKYLVKSHK